MIKKLLIYVFCAAVALALTSGCKNKQTDERINLTMWHVYGEQVDSPLNNLIMEFNRTVGAEKGISVSVTAVTNSNKIHKYILSSLNDEPGAAEMPDIFNCYPKTVSAMRSNDILVDYRDYFTQEELDGYVQPFLDEGTFDGKLLIFPVAKSTEMLFVNKTLFDRFAADTGAKLDDLRTWEGVYATSLKYREWTDSLTPDVPNDGKTFFVTDYPFNYFQIGTQSLGEEFFDGDKLSFSPSCKKEWELISNAAFKGGVWLGDGYATEALRTGEAIASVASSASVLYYEDKVIYEDNTSENIEIEAMPYPVFEGGSKMVMQRGSGFCVTKSTPEREEAACTFIKWLTEAQRNTDFVTSLGYVPVTKAAYDTALPKAIDALTDTKYKNLYKAIYEMNPDYEFYYAPRFESYLDIEEKFIVTIRDLLNEGHSEYTKALDEGRADDEFTQKLIDEYYERLKQTMSEQ